MEKIVGKYQLRWSDNGSGARGFSKGLDIFHNMYSKNNYQDMVAQLKDAFSKLDSKYSAGLMYCVLTGLRPAEACASLQLLKKRKEEYWARDKQVLEHFKFPETFMRRTKMPIFLLHLKNYGIL